MRRRAAFIVLAFVSLVTPLAVPLARGAAAPPASSGADRVLGEWNGALDVASRKIRLVFHISKRADGGLAGTMDSPDQGANGIALDTVSVSGDTLRLDLLLGKASYRGVLAADSPTLRGTWAQSGYSFPLDLGREAAPVRRRPQDPVKPYPYSENEVVVENASANLRLACTFTKPQGPGPFPAVLLITGSGPQNRNEEIMGHRPFLVLADHLTRHGLAVLRCDDRGTAQSTGDFATATTADFATDARAGLEYLLARQDVDRARVGLIGHSEGAIIAPMLAARDPRVAFIVMLAGPGVPGDSLIQLQRAALARSAGKTDSAIARTARMQAARATSPWSRWFATYDPRPALQKTACPVLALFGGRDVQVPPRENLPAVSRALHAGGNRDVSTLELPGLNHLFQTSSTGMPAEYGALEETFAPAALDTITAWIEARVKPTPRGR